VKSAPIDKNDDSEKKKKKRFDSQQAQAIAKYSGLAIQMGIIIVLGVLLGQKLDAWLEMEKPIFSLICSLLSVFAAIYYSLKDFITPTKNQDK
jgi:membrane protein DedA with SNARE-associated domain